ncbi:hypothetical protein FDP41_009820 [Naegleria fowleri]|uniref:Uncharacterized protein n=1 Tax=Naegleria fowleri TaxID=5763 RepID=A0A6A5BDI7_NAEFO|nr:uncharacterized protein FDP41_009820 [Naegleria fowleri]KAF0972124.1 hypothetical protein FDP41_009820 [Naegleria fowleri]
MHFSRANSMCNIDDEISYGSSPTSKSWFDIEEGNDHEGGVLYSDEHFQRITTPDRVQFQPLSSSAINSISENDEADIPEMDDYVDYQSMDKNFNDGTVVPSDLNLATSPSTLHPQQIDQSSGNSSFSVWLQQSSWLLQHIKLNPKTPFKQLQKTHLSRL